MRKITEKRKEAKHFEERIYRDCKLAGTSSLKKLQLRSEIVRKMNECKRFNVKSTQIEGTEPGKSQHEITPKSIINENRILFMKRNNLISRAKHLLALEMDALCVCIRALPRRDIL